MNYLLKTALSTRAIMNRTLHPKRYYVGSNSSLKPVSRKFGIDRGTPIDRYYIDNFIKKHASDINGVCIEIGDDRYLTQYGKSHISRKDILDINRKNTAATIYGDLRHLPHIKSNTYNCAIITQVIGMIDDCDATISELYRILKPGGVLLLTASSVSPAIDTDYSFWRFTQKSIEYLLKKHFKKKNIFVETKGNVLVGQYFWIGMVQEDLTKKQLDFYDKQYPIIVLARAIK